MSPVDAQNARHYGRLPMPQNRMRRWRSPGGLYCLQTHVHACTRVHPRARGPRHGVCSVLFWAGKRPSEDSCNAYMRRICETRVVVARSSNETVPTTSCRKWLSRTYATNSAPTPHPTTQESPASWARCQLASHSCAQQGRFQAHACPCCAYPQAVPPTPPGTEVAAAAPSSAGGPGFWH